jgi:hypothetical protein
MCVLSPQHMAQRTQNSDDFFSSNTGLLTFTGHKCTIHCNTSNNLPTTTQQKLLHIHQCMGHLHMTCIQQLACEGYFGVLYVGDCVSGDQLESTSPGLVPTYHGTPTTSKHHTGTLFVYQASRFLYFMPHLSTGSEEAIAAKHHFEPLVSSYNHHIKHYHTDNGVFSTKLFHSSCTQ